MTGKYLPNSSMGKIKCYEAQHTIYIGTVPGMHDRQALHYYIVSIITMHNSMLVNLKTCNMNNFIENKNGLFFNKFLFKVEICNVIHEVENLNRLRVLGNTEGEKRI